MRNQGVVDSTLPPSCFPHECVSSDRSPEGAGGKALPLEAPVLGFWDMNVYVYYSVYYA